MYLYTCIHIVTTTKLSMIDVVNRFSRVMIDTLLCVRELGKNDGTRNFYKWWMHIKGGGAFINGGGVGGGIKCSFHYD